MIRKVYTTTEEFLTQNTQLGTRLPFARDTAVLKTSGEPTGRIGISIKKGSQGLPFFIMPARSPCSRPIR